MSYLPNHKWELFTRELVELTLAGDQKARAKAYERAGYLPNPHNARRLANRAPVKARFNELFQEACEYRNITAAKLVVRIDRVGRANLADLFEDDGRTLKNIKTLPRELSEALESIEWIEDGADESGKPRYLPKVKLLDKNAANFTLLKHFGGLPEPAPPPASGLSGLFNALSVDDQQILLGVLEAIGRGQGGADRAITIEHSQPGSAP